MNKPLSADHLRTTGRMTRILVCGGRGYGCVPDNCPPERLEAERARALNERAHLYGVLAIHRPGFVMQGGARGADEWARHWAKRNKIPHRTFPAHWNTHGKAAGPIRNQRMIDEGRPDLVVAFPGGRGTADMVRRARAAGIEVLEVGGREMGR